MHNFFNKKSVKGDLVSSKVTCRTKTCIYNHFKDYSPKEKKRIMKKYPTDFDFIHRKLFNNEPSETSDRYDHLTQLRYLIFHLKVLYEYMKRDFE